MKNNILIILAVAFLVTIVLGVYFVFNTETGTEAVEGEQNTAKQSSAIDGIERKTPIILKIAHSLHFSHPQNMALVEKFVPMVEKGSDWNIRVEIYPNSQLAGEKRYIQGVRQGTIEMCIAGQYLPDILPKSRVLQLPYVFDSYDQAKKLLDGEPGVKITEGMESLGIKNLAWGLNGFGEISLADNNMNIRAKIATLSTNIGIDTLKAMGFDAVPVEIEDMAMTLKQTSVGGHDNPPLLSYYNSWYENEKKIILTNHIIYPSMYMISTKFWNTLPDDYRALIKSAARESADYEIKLLKDQEQEIFSALKEKGVVIESPDLTQYKKVASSLYDRWTKDDEDLKDILYGLKEGKLK